MRLFVSEENRLSCLHAFIKLVSVTVARVYANGKFMRTVVAAI